MAVEGDFVRLTNPLPQVIRREHRVVADLAQAGCAVGPDVGIRADEDARVADEAPKPADRGGPLTGALQAERAVVGPQDARRREVRQQRVAHPDRPGAGAATTVRRREGLVDVEVHDIEAGLARFEPAENRIEVRPVHIGERARFMDRVEEIADPLLE